MRPLEILIPLTLGLYLLWPHPRPLAVRFLPALALLLTLVHFGTEGYRWQMIPLYLLTAALGISALLKIHAQSDWRPLASGLAFGLLLMSTALPLLLPVPVIPAPDGPYPVGTRLFELRDPARRELYSGRDEARRFMIQVWYPTIADPSAPRAAWMANAEVFAPAIATYIRMPSFFLDHLALVRMPASQDTPVADAASGFPIILFSHGWNGFNAQNTGQALQLASQGFVVVAVQHTYGAVVTVFPDGTIARNNPEALASDDTPTEAYEAIAHRLADQWAGDLTYALTFMEQQNGDPASPFHNKLDVSRVGAYGHSTGGGAAIQFCGTDPRCQAVLGQDPFMRPVTYEVLDGGLAAPAFFMFSQRWADDTDSRNNELFNRFYPHLAHPFGAVAIEGTAHYDFSDLPLLSPLAPQLGLKGPINGTRVTTLVNDYLVSFFRMTLLGQSTALFSEPAPYPEIRVLK